MVINCYANNLIFNYTVKIQFNIILIFQDIIDLKGKLPASLLSDMWGRFWNNLYSDVEPYPNKPNLDISQEMKEQGYNVKKMFKSADDFYAGMGLKRVPNTFWNSSMLEKPKDGRKVVCHASAWDFYDGKVRFLDHSNK